MPSEFDMPTVDQIKAAIYTYGPITAGVCAGNVWDTTPGVFSRPMKPVRAAAPPTTRSSWWAGTTMAQRLLDPAQLVGRRLGRERLYAHRLQHVTGR